MSERTVVPGWTIITYDRFEPMAFGPKDESVTVNDDDTITIAHEGYSGSERVTVPIRWLTEAIAETLAYRAALGGKP